MIRSYFLFRSRRRPGKVPPDNDNLKRLMTRSGVRRLGTDDFSITESQRKDYFLVMVTLASPRRIACILIAVLFGHSMVAHGFAVSRAMAKMMVPDTSMDMTSMDMGASGHPMDCGGKDIGAKTACFAMCASAVAILCDPARVPVISATRELTIEPQVPTFGRGIPPEPHPPKQA